MDELTAGSDVTATAGLEFKRSIIKLYELDVSTCIYPLGCLPTSWIMWDGFAPSLGRKAASSLELTMPPSSYDLDWVQDS